MSEAQPTHEQEKAWALECPTCGAQPGQACDKPKSEHGVASQRQPVHRARYMAGVRSHKQRELLCTYPKCKCIVGTSTSQPEPTCPKGLPREVYLGDAVFARFDGFHIWLRTGDGGNQRIALDPFVLDKLVAYNEKLKRDFLAAMAAASPGTGGTGEKKE